MNENKRFSTNGHYIYDHFNGEERWLVNEVEANEIVDVMNNLDCKARERSKALSKLQKENDEIKQLIHTMLVQIEVDKINTKNVRYWAGIIFTFKEFQKMREIWKGDFE